MIRLIAASAVLCILAAFVALNQSSTADLNLLGVRLESVSTLVVGVGGFVLGVLSTVAVYLLGSLDRRRLARIRAREQELAAREAALSAKESAAGSAADGKSEPERAGPPSPKRSRRESRPGGSRP